jgi:hypothetical protein
MTDKRLTPTFIIMSILLSAVLLVAVFTAIIPAVCYLAELC